jgi:hypothetical protein
MTACRCGGAACPHWIRKIMSELFNVVFAGQIAAGADPVAVRANIARLFKVNDAMLEKLFSGQRVAVKKAVDQAGAMKLRAMMKQAGAIALMEACDAQGKALAAPAAPAAAPAAPVAAAAPAVAAAAPARPAAPAPTMAQRIAAMAAQHEKDAALRPDPDAPPPPADVQRTETWKLFPVGAVLTDISRVAARAPLMPDISRLSMANLGKELLEADERAKLAPTPVVVPDLSAIKIAAPGAAVLRDDEKAAPVAVMVDISAMSMAPPNTDVLKENEKRVVVPVVVDVSGMSMAPPGTDLEEIRVEKVLVNPDTSRLKLA